jgi:hemerythrin
MKKPLNEEVKTGIPSLDKQHEEFLDILNKLNSPEKNQDEIWGIFISIENYIRHHFTEEERYMESLKYFDYDNHKSLHKKFIDEYKEISDEMTNYDSVDIMLPSLKAFIENWVKNHYQEADKKFASFLKGHKD